MNSSKYKKILPVFVLLVVIPAIFSFLLYLYILRIDKQHDIDSVKNKLSEKAVDFVSQTSPEKYFKPYFHRLSEKAIELVCYMPDSKESRAQFVQELENLRKKLSHDIRCVIFDKHGLLLNGEILTESESRFYQYMWSYAKRLSPMNYRDKRFDQLNTIGKELDMDILYDLNDECVGTFNLGKRGVLYILQGQEKSGVIVFVEHHLDYQEIMKNMIKQNSTSEEPIVMYTSTDKSQGFAVTQNNQYSYEQICSEEFINGVFDKNHIWKSFDFKDYRLLLGQEFTQNTTYRQKQWIAAFVTILLLIIAGILYFKNFAGTDGIKISIRYKLIFIFSLAVYIPAFALWALSYGGLQDHRTVLENDIKKGMQDILLKIDNDYTSVVETVTQKFKELDKKLAEFSGKPVPTKNEITKILQTITKGEDISYFFNWLDIRTIDQQQIYTTHAREANDRLLRVGRVISMLCLEKYCPERLTAAGIKKTQSDILIGDFLDSPVLGFSGLFERPSSLYFLDFDGSGVYWWWNYFPDQNNKIAFYICNSAIRESSSIYFKALQNRRFTLGNTALKIVSHNYNVLRYFPESAQDEPDIQTVINTSNINKTYESAVINYQNNRYLCFCIPGTKLKECFVLCLYPIYEIDYKIEKTKSTIYALMIMLLAISILTGLLLSNTFIVPVNELNRGLNALRMRDTETKINITNKDELGNLGTAFNQMMSDIKDMLMAGAIQQCLIPTGEFSIPGYDYLIYNRMATDVGGDYADLFELPNDRLLIVIGDVTGHGVSSALLTAMVKASVFRFAHKDTSLREIVTQTSNMICDLLNKKKLMTFCAITLDKNTGEMAVCNAGHPYPMIHTCKGKLRTPCKTSLPLGVSKKRCRYDEELEKLEIGETLILYTDGFPEAENEAKEEYGYDKFQQLITDSEINTPKELQDKLLAVFDEHHKAEELSDDVTFIILKRKDKV